LNPGGLKRPAGCTVAAAAAAGPASHAAASAQCAV
jgi:hypothetical protein